MSAKGLADTAAELVGNHFVKNGANKAIQSLPQKPNKIKGLLIIATAIMMFRSGLKLMKKA